jgi:hypothetical protein
MTTENMISHVGATIKGYWRDGIEYTGRVVHFIGDSLLGPGKVSSKWIRYEPTVKAAPTQTNAGTAARRAPANLRKPVDNQNAARMEMARLDALITEHHAEALRRAARDFANKQILASRVYPFAFDAMVEVYTQALMDDRDTPLAGRARVVDLEAMCAKLQPHNLMKERVSVFDGDGKSFK